MLKVKFSKLKKNQQNGNPDSHRVDDGERNTEHHCKTLHSVFN